MDGCCSSTRAVLGICVGRGMLIAFLLLSVMIPGHWFHQVAFAEISVSTVAVYLSDNNRNERVCIQNNGNQSKDVDIEVRFGYPVSDAAGNVSFRFTDPTSNDGQSAVNWIRVFPCSFSIPPGGSQIVVLVSDPPPDLADGEYWARPVMTFRTTRVDSNCVATCGDSSKVVLSLNYRHGKVSTGVELGEISLLKEGKEWASILVDIKRTGNAAFLGNLVFRLRDLDGAVVIEEGIEIAVYHSLRRGIDFNCASLKDGNYEAEIELNSSRKGGQPGDILHAPTVSRRYWLTPRAHSNSRFLVTRDKSRKSL